MKFYFLLISLVLFSFVGFAGSMVPAESPVIISSIEEFKSFWDEAKDKEAGERARLFEKTVISKNKPIYQTMVEKNKKALRKRINKTISKLTQKDVDRVFINFSKFEKTIPQQIKLFRKDFPDAKFDALFWLGVSLRFNGKVSDVKFDRKQKQTVVGFGMEHFYPTDDLGVIMSHEMIHMYRCEKLGSPPKDIYRMVQEGWSEGLATYGSGVLNKKSDYETILFDKGLGRSCKNDYRELADKFLKEIETKDDEQKKRWFLGRETENYDVPVRAGYCVGLKVVEHLAKNNKFSEMIIWPWDKVQTEFISSLEGLN